MKKLFTLFIAACSIATVQASTSITTPAVSGHWTLAGSPYLIFNNISIATTAALTIDPGVNVIFQGGYSLSVNGILHAAGTATQKVTFTVNDTTGWSDDNIGTGGWHGIQFHLFGGTGTDSSILKHCNISYIKIDSADFYASVTTSAPLSGGVFTARSLSVVNCEIFKGKTLGIGCSRLINFETYPGRKIELANCDIHDNWSASMVVMDSYLGDSSYMHDNSVHDNYGANGIMMLGVNLVFEKNDVFNNTSADGIIKMGGSSAGTFHGTVKGNKIHDNVNDNIAALTCYSGYVDIMDNIVCNNHHTFQSNCLAIEGGGGIRVYGNDTNDYHIYNNIIANNYAVDNGGGIMIYFANVSITNNTIINNKAENGGAISILGTDTTTITIKNNIITGNVSTNSAGVVSGGAYNKFKFGYNYMEHPFYQDVNFYYGIFDADTATNIIGSNPGLIAPTDTCGIGEPALPAKFGLLATSPCVDKGDNSVVLTGTHDYAGKPRITGAKVDIGAYEYIKDATAIHSADLVATTIQAYPNPAHDQVTIATPAANGRIDMMDVFGKTVATQNITAKTTSFNLQNIPSGIYLLVWHSATGLKMSQKVLVE